MFKLSMLRKKASNGGPEWAFHLGCCLLRGEYETDTGVVQKIRRNIKEGLYWLRSAAEKGNYDAMIELGAYYADTAKGDKSKLLTALFWEKKAWRANCEIAGQNIAVTYSQLGNRQLCHKWLQQGYKRCKWSTRLSLAKTFLCGYGVRRNVPKAEQLFRNVLRDHGSHPSHKALAKKYLRMIKRGESPDDSVVYP